MIEGYQYRLSNDAAGRRILNLQTTLALLHSPVATKTQSFPNSEDVGTHPALEGLANLSNVPLGEILTKPRLARLATQMGMREIIRWEPRLVGCLFDFQYLVLTMNRRIDWTHPESM